jgi:hypothetical protein
MIDETRRWCVQVGATGSDLSTYSTELIDPVPPGRGKRERKER